MSPLLPNRSRLLFLALVAMLVLVSSSACFAQFSGPGPTVQTPTTATVTTDRALLFPPARDPMLSPGDLIQIHVFDQLDYAPEVRAQR